MMKKLKIKIAVLMFLGIASFLSCEKIELVDSEIDLNQKIVLTESNFPEFIEHVEKKFSDNETFVEVFLSKAENDNLDKESMRKMLDILNIPMNMNTDNLEDANILKGTYDLLKSQKGNFYYRNSISGEECEKLVKIRDAMLDECSKYIVGLDEACSAAVMLAYWWKSRDCKIA